MIRGRDHAMRNPHAQGRRRPAPADHSGGWPVSVRLESTLSSPDHAPWVDGVAPWIAANGGLILSNRRVATPRRARKPDVLEDPYRHPWRNRSPHHQDGP